MARGTALSDLVTMLKAEIGYSLTSGVATAEDARLKILLSTTQKWLAADFDWPFLKRTGDVLLAAGDRTGTLPTTLDYERPVMVSSQDQDIWVPVVYGISPQDFNAWNSDDDERSDPVRKIQYATDTTFEVWPLPATESTVRFVGQKRLDELAADDDEAELDDLLLVLFTAAELLAGQKQADAEAKLVRAQKRLDTLKAAYPKPLQVFKLGGGGCACEEKFSGGTITGGPLANTAGGTVPLVQDESAGHVSYSFGRTPIAITLTVQSPAGGSIIAASVDGAATDMGFDYALTSAPDSATYFLTWEATF